MQHSPVKRKPPVVHKVLLIKKAKEFFCLHEVASILLPPYAWDVLSAKIYEQLGFKAIGTISTGISAKLLLYSNSEDCFNGLKGSL
jgi:hypothetical protein